MLQLSIILINSLISFNVFAAHTLPEFSARYAVKKFGIKLAEAHYQLHYTKTGYRFNQNTDLYGIAVYFSNYAVAAVSQIDEDGDRLLLRKHTYILSGSDDDRNEDIDILWQTPENTLDGAVSGIVRGEKIELSTDSEIWDLLSFQIPLMIEANKEVKEYTYRALLVGEINTYTFELTEIKKVTFNDKEYDALRMVCVDPDRDREFHIWLLPELHNIPVLIEDYRDGSRRYSGQLESVSFNNGKPYIDKRTGDVNEDKDEDDF